jgi:hypothetical protein
MGLKGTVPGKGDKNRIISIGIVGILIISGYMGFIIFKSELVEASTLYVGGGGAGNYSSIQGAINDANPGGTVFVYSGIYYQHVIVNKNINLTGENRDTTIIDGQGKH